MYLEYRGGPSVAAVQPYYVFGKYLSGRKLNDLNITVKHDLMSITPFEKPRS